MTEVGRDKDAETAAYRRLADTGRVDGMIVVGPHKGDERFDLMRDSGLPFVSLGEPPGQTDMPVMLYDEGDAISEVVKHLAALGHRRVAQVAGPQESDAASLRRQLYQQQLREHGLYDSWWIEADYTAAGGRAATERLLDATEPPTAIIFSNDLMALAGMSAAYARGMLIPDDISIVGWDDIVVSQYLHPQLSTVSQHPYEVASS